MISEATRYKRETGEKFDPFKLAEELIRKGKFKKALDLIRNTMAKKKLGVGSSRVAIETDKGTVLKIALNKAGLEQNKTEIQIANEVQTSIVPEVYESHPSGFWLEMELVNPIENSNTEYDHWAEQFGFETFDDFELVVGDPSALDNIDKSSMSSDQRKLLSYLMLLVEGYGVADFGSPFDDDPRSPNIGFGKDGRAVIIDFGFNAGIYQDYYLNRGDADSARTPGGTPRVWNEHLQTMIREGVEEALIMNTIKAALDRYIEELAASETMYTADTLSKMGRQEVDKMLKNNGMHLSDEAIEELGNYFYSQMRASGNFADLSTLQSPFGWRVLPMSRG